MKHLEVVAGIIFYKGKILCVQRDKTKYDYTSYKFEFPGGKMEQGETPIEALQRELLEELNLEVICKEQKAFMSIEHTYPDFKIMLHCYLCEAKTQDFVLKEHFSYQWLPKEDLDTLDWVEADWSVIKKIQTLNNESI